MAATFYYSGDMPLSRTSATGTVDRPPRAVRRRVIAILCCATCLAAPLAIAQFRDRLPGSGIRDRFRGDVSRYERRRRMPSRSEFPTWDIKEGFQHDVFTFARVEYDSVGPFGWWCRWDNDYPDSDWNFSYRLQQLTALEVATESKVVRLTDPELFELPFLYMAGVQSVSLSRPEQAALRRYLLNGGFLMMDDFWSPRGRDHVLGEMRAVFPDRAPVELGLEHPIFHNVYDLQELPQVVDIRTWREGYSFERWHGPSGGDEAPHFWAYFDDDDRVVALLCHNNDLGDGWEREGENPDYFRQYSERYSYPLGINIVTYALTH
jgi:hypothetical protein